MADNSLTCICHVADPGDSSIIRSVNNIIWEKLITCMKEWSQLDGKEKDIAISFDIKKKNISGYHRECYQKFTSARRLEQARKRQEKGTARLSDDKEEPTPTPSKVRKVLTRSQIFPSISTNATRRSTHVLPVECIVCRKSKTTVSISTGKRSVEKLVSYETDCSNLIKAARVKEDDYIIILLRIGDFDPVSIEVRYHASCYKKYTKKCLYVNKKCDAEEKPLQRIFDRFCLDTIDIQIVHNGDILRISYLTKIFINLAADIEDINILDYRNSQLKARLLTRYGDKLQFVKISPNSCEVVFYRQDTVEQSCSYITLNGDDDSYDSDGEWTYEATQNTNYSGQAQDEFANLYRSALHMCESISAVDGLVSWPPKANELNMENAKQIVPTFLFNYIAWSCGLSSEFMMEKVPLTEKNEKKVLSLAQDFIYLASHGRTLTPKHISLGMTIRHLTGSAQLQKLINSYGHCVSHSQTLEHDTALATQQLDRDCEIPEGFVSKKFTTLVWDNNDFGEETLTGKGTTHNTNGIILQRSNGDEAESQGTSLSFKRDRKRTFDAPPILIDEFHGMKRKGPFEFIGNTPDIKSYADVQKTSRLIDQSLHFARLLKSDITLPGRTACNQMITKDLHDINRIGFLPVIDASPTEKSTVNAILEKSLELANNLDLPSIVIVFDQAIYAKAQEIRWQGRQELRDRLVLRLGEFHTSMAFLGAVGKRFENSGLKDIAIESGLVAEGSINGVMNGHHYNRSIRCHKIISEALHRLRKQEFLDQLAPAELDVALNTLENVKGSFPSNFMTTINSTEWTSIHSIFHDHVEERCREDVMYAFWSSYLDMIDLLLLFIRATREGNWDLHLSAVRDMIPWFFAYGRINYSRYLPCYYMEMRALPEKHPFIHERLVDGEFAVKRHDSHAFAKTACDQVIEQTFNRSSKTKGGLTGITLNKGAVRRWILSHPERAAISSACFSLICPKEESTRSSSEQSASRIKADDKAVENVMATVSEFVNPFLSNETTELINICSGMIAPENIKSDLLTAYNQGESCFKEFVADRLVSPKKDLFDKLSLPNPKTFSDLEKKRSKSSFEKDSIKDSRQLFARLLIVAEEKKLDMKDLMKYPLASIPPSLATYDGSLAKTNKSNLMHEIEKLLPKEILMEQITYSSQTVLIVDAMAMIQQQKYASETFGKFADSILIQLISFGRKCNATRIDFVIDRYKHTSIKQLERNNRASHGQTRIHIKRSDQSMPKQLKKFLSCSSNKEELLKFLVDKWKTAPPAVLSGVQLYATRQDLCFKIYAENNTVKVEEVPELHSDHEEADTRMFLHAQHAATSLTSDVIIRSVDTDVFILAIWVSSKLQSRLLLQMASGNTRCFDMTKIGNYFGSGGQALIGLHPFTGCDTVSAFKGKGKAKALKLAMGCPEYEDAFSQGMGSE